MPMERWERIWQFAFVSGIAAAIGVGTLHPASNGEKPTEVLPQADENACFSVSPERLAASPRPDSDVSAIWIDFYHGKIAYTAVHAFGQNYILLSSNAKNRSDFKIVYTDIAGAFGSSSADDIDDRGDDISAVIDVTQPFTQASVAGMVGSFYKREFDAVKISRVYFR
jgi:hypothetical protein